MTNRELKNRFYRDLTDFMDQHKRADELVFSEVSGYPLKAVYYCPPSKYMEDELEELANMDPRIKKLIEMAKELKESK